MKINLLRKKQDNGVNLLWVVIIVVALSLVMVTISFVYFINSNSYNTVKQISAANSSLQKDDLDGYDTTSPIQAKDINVYSKTLNARINNFNDEEDFGNGAISQEALGY